MCICICTGVERVGLSQRKSMGLKDCKTAKKETPAFGTAHRPSSLLTTDKTVGRPSVLKIQCQKLELYNLTCALYYHFYKDFIKSASVLCEIILQQRKKKAKCRKKR